MSRRRGNGRDIDSRDEIYTGSRDTDGRDGRDGRDAVNVFKKSDNEGLIIDDGGRGGGGTCVWNNF